VLLLRDTFAALLLVPLWLAIRNTSGVDGVTGGSTRVTPRDRYGWAMKLMWRSRFYDMVAWIMMEEKRYAWE